MLEGLIIIRKLFYFTSGRKMQIIKTSVNWLVFISECISEMLSH